MITVKIIGSVLLALLLGVGSYRICGKSPDPILNYRSAVWRATGNLSKQHQIRPGDLKLPSPLCEMVDRPVQQFGVGRYLVVAKKQGEIVSPDDLAEVPLSPEDGRTPVVMYSNKDQDAFISALEPGMVLMFCSVSDASSKSPVTPRCTCSIKVVAVHRSTSASDSSWLALEVPRQQLRNAFVILAGPAKPLILSKGLHPQ